MARDPRKNAHVAHVLYSHFIAGPGDLSAAARRAGIAASTLYEFCENKRDLPARLIAPLSFGDVELFEKLSGARDNRLIVSDAPSGLPTSEATRDVAMSVGIQTGQLLDAVMKADADNTITEEEAELILDEKSRLESLAERLGEIVTRRRMRVV